MRMTGYSMQVSGWTLQNQGVTCKILRNAGELEGLRVYPPPTLQMEIECTLHCFSPPYKMEKVCTPTLFFPIIGGEKVQRVWNFTKPFVHMWQSCVKVKDYSVACFDRIAAFEASYRWTSVKGGAYMHFTHLQSMDEPCPYGSSVVWHFKHGNTIKTHEQIIFDCYMGLSHIHLSSIKVW